MRLLMQVLLGVSLVWTVVWFAFLLSGTPLWWLPIGVGGALTLGGFYALASSSDFGA